MFLCVHVHGQRASGTRCRVSGLVSVVVGRVGSVDLPHVGGNTRFAFMDGVLTHIRSSATMGNGTTSRMDGFGTTITTRSRTLGVSRGDLLASSVAGTSDSHSTLCTNCGGTIRTFLTVPVTSVTRTTGILTRRVGSCGVGATSRLSGRANLLIGFVASLRAGCSTRITGLNLATFIAGVGRTGRHMEALALRHAGRGVNMSIKTLGATHATDSGTCHTLIGVIGTLTLIFNRGSCTPFVSCIGARVARCGHRIVNRGSSTPSASNDSSTSSNDDAPDNNNSASSSNSSSDNNSASNKDSSSSKSGSCVKL